MAESQYDAGRARAEVEQALDGLRAEGCICPLEFKPGQGGLVGKIIPTCEVHYPLVVRRHRHPCPTKGCPGDGRYAPPGRGHKSGCDWFAQRISSHEQTRPAAPKD